jgi:Transglutaminase-like superfamily
LRVLHYIYMMRLWLVIFVFLSISISGFAQNDYKLGKAKRRDSRDVKKLAHALTDHLPSDSLKVKSIYIWLCNNISYDARGFSSGSGSYTSPKVILRHRTAVCLGISILFDSLCAEAGIQSEQVLGYVYMPWYEVRDTLYLDSHAWNAVKIDGEWKLIDATWGAGYLKTRKQPIRRIVMRVFGKAPRVRYKFIRKPNFDYFCADPAWFIYSHFPSTPAWQLLDCSVPIDSFQRSPNSTKNYLENPVNCKHGNDSIEAIVSADRYEHGIIAGRQAIVQNRHNHQDISYGYSIYARKLFMLSIDTTLSKEERIRWCDSTVYALDSMIKYFRLTSKDAREEGKFFLRRNDRMRKQVLGESRPHIRTHLREGMAVRRDRLRARSQIQKLRNENQRLRKQNRDIKKKKIKVSRPDKPSNNQALQYDRLDLKTQKNETFIDSLKTEMGQAAHVNFRYEAVQYDTNTYNRKILLMIMDQDLMDVLIARRFGYTCYDTAVYTFKNEYLRSQYSHDSIRLATRKPGLWVSDSAAKAYGLHAAKAKLLLKQNMSTYQQMARLPAGNVDEVAAFEKSRSEYVAINDSMIVANNERIREMRAYAISLNHLRKLHRNVRAELRIEIRMENYRHSAHGRFFREYFRGVDRMFRRNVQQTSRMKGQERRYKAELIRAIKREQRAAEKKKRLEEKKRKLEEAKQKKGT